MAQFKIGSGDWGSPLASEATFDSLEEAQAAAGYLPSRPFARGALLPLTQINATSCCSR
jgi:hypothetical protein